MRDDVKICVLARLDFFEKYYSVPDDMAAAVENFKKDLVVLAGHAADAAGFEAEFAEKGLAERFNSILTKCTPLPYKMTAEEKQNARDTAKEIFREDRGRILKEAAADAAESVFMAAESEHTAKRQRRMAQEGTLDDYTRASNIMDDAERLAGFFAKRRKK